MEITMSERRTITKLYADRYRRARKKEKGKTLDEFLSLTGYQRCYGAWLLWQQRKRVVLSPKRPLTGDVKAMQTCPRNRITIRP